MRRIWLVVHLALLLLVLGCGPMPTPPPTAVTNYRIAEVTATPSPLPPSPTPTPTPTSTPTPTLTPTPTPTPPPLEATIEVEPAVVVPGHTAVLYLNSTLPTTAIAFLDNWNLPLFSDEEGLNHTALIGVYMWTEVGLHTLSANLTDSLGRTVVVSTTMEVLPPNYPVEYIYLPPSRSALLDPETIQEEWALLEPIYTSITPERFWEGAFITPTPGLLFSLGLEFISDLDAGRLSDELRQECERHIFLTSTATITVWETGKRWKISDGNVEYPREYRVIKEGQSLNVYTRWRITSAFGKLRSYNDAPVSSYHAGVDIGNLTGTLVLAPQRGRIVLARRLTIRGNTILLDHGWGVVSSFFHMSATLVQEGEMVEVGQPIGEIGATGLVTGAHLHWELRIGLTPVDPLEWVHRGDFFR